MSAHYRNCSTRFERGIVMYSFIRPEKKSIISKLTKIWVFYFILSIILVALYLGAVESQKLYMSIQTEENLARKKDYQNKIAQLEAEFVTSRSDVNFTQQVQSQSDRISKSIANLFDLTPDQITLHSVEMKKDMLTLKGVTPSKEIYNFLLEAPLRSIFNESRVDFFPLANGWYNFVSVSRLHDFNTTQEKK